MLGLLKKFQAGFAKTVAAIGEKTGALFGRKPIDASSLDALARHKIYEGNARRVYPRLDAALKAKGK